MRALFSQFSALVGILTFVNQMLSAAQIEKALLTGVGSGLAVYVVLLLGDVAIQRVVEHAAAAEETVQAGAQAPQAQSMAAPEASTSASKEQDAKAA
jgi:hypothetical protein